MIERLRNAATWFIGLIRAPLWWDSKLPLALGLAYSLAWSMHVPATALYFPMALLLVGGITSAIFASIFNDLLDEDEDRLAGKFTGMMQLSPTGKKVVLGLTLASMAATAILLARYPAALAVYLSIWAFFTLYSLPPFRLKARGIWGVLCCALGEHFLYVLSIVLAAGAAHKTPPISMIIAIVTFAMAFGVRSILWHQLEDSENDRISGIDTLGAKYDPKFLRRLGEWCVFPLELFTLGVILVGSHSPVAWILLVCYAIVERQRARGFHLNIVIVAPRPQYRFAMLEYYQLFLPVAFLIEYVRHDINAVPLLLAQLLLIPSPMRVLSTHTADLVRRRLTLSYERVKSSMRN